MIFTFGYGNRTNYNQLIEYFESKDIKYLIDVRLTPYGWSSLWHCTQLEKMCERHGVQYLSKKELGNTSGNKKWVPTDSKRASVALLSVAEIVKHSNIVLMCSELDVNKCHRKEVSENLSIMSGKPVVHLS